MTGDKESQQDSSEKRHLSRRVKGWDPRGSCEEDEEEKDEEISWNR